MENYNKTIDEIQEKNQKIKMKLKYEKPYIELIKCENSNFIKRLIIL